MKKYTNEHKIIATEYAEDLLNLMRSLGVHIENSKMQTEAIVYNIIIDIKKNLPHIEIFNAESATQRMNIISQCQLLDVLEVTESLYPEKLRQALFYEFQLTCTVAESLEKDPEIIKKIRLIKKSPKAFNAVWKPFNDYYTQMNQIKPLIQKIFDFQGRDHVKDALKLYTSNPQVGRWILAVKANPRYHYEFTKYIGHLRSQY